MENRVVMVRVLFRPIFRDCLSSIAKLWRSLTLKYFRESLRFQHNPKLMEVYINLWKPVLRTKTWEGWFSGQVRSIQLDVFKLIIIRILTDHVTLRLLHTWPHSPSIFSSLFISKLAVNHNFLIWNKSSVFLYLKLL